MAQIYRPDVEHPVAARRKQLIIGHEAVDFNLVTYDGRE